MFTLKAVIGIVAGILSIIAAVPYIYSILQGKTRPARTTWFIWSIVTIILFITYAEVGGGTALWVSLGYVIGVGIVALLSIKYGRSGWSLLDKIVFGGCAITVLVWFVTGSPLVGLIMIMITDILGGIPTLRHSYYVPYEESKLAWILGFSANTLNLFAVEKWDFAHAAYPVYLFLMVGAITWFVIMRRTRYLL